MPAKRRFFKRTKSQEVEEKEKKVVEKLQKGEVEFRKVERTVKKGIEPKKRPHFPSISRSIPDPTSLKLRGTGFAPLASKVKLLSIKFPKMGLKWGIVIVFIMLGLVWNYFVGSMLYKSFISWSSLMQQRQKIADQMQLWENISQQYPNYRDAYVKGAIFAYELGDREKEQYFLGKLQLLDPNFPLTKTFQKLINLQQSLNQ